MLKEMRLPGVDEDIISDWTIETVDFDLGTDLLKLINDLNENLGNTYGGKFKFDYVLQDFKKIDKLKINIKRKEKLKEEWFKKSSELAKTQTEVERKLLDK